MALPLCDDLHVHAFLNRTRYKHPAKRPLAESRQAKSPARARQRFLRIANPEQTLVVRLACTETLEKWSNLGVNGNFETRLGFLPKGSRFTAFEIHVAARQ